jgi:hypothetical protein
MSPLVHLDDDVDVDVLEAPRGRTLKPGYTGKPLREPMATAREQTNRDVIPDGYQSWQYATQLPQTAHDRAVTRAYDALEKALEEKKPEATIKRLHDKLDEARAAAEIAERQKDERLKATSQALARKTRNTRLATQRAGSDALIKARESDLIVMTCSYAGVTIQAYPTRPHDATIRAHVLEAFRSAASLMGLAAEKEVQSARIRAMGGTPEKGWSPEGLARRISDDARVAIRENAFTISVGRGA